MPEQTISPGVFTEERDQTFLAQGVNNIGGAFVGPTGKGPAFRPVEVSSPQDFEEKFGNEGLYMDLSARNYLRDASSATVMRILGEEGYKSESVEIQLPEGELSKPIFQITRSDFQFGNDNLKPGDEVDFEISVGGRQRRTTDDELLAYNITVEEYVDGEFHDLVYSGEAITEDAVVGTFNVSTNEQAEVQYQVEVELEDGQVDTITSPTAEVDGFFLESINYNWAEGEARGEDEILSLQGTVGNLASGSEYKYEVYRETASGPVLIKEDSGIQTEDFTTFFVHDGQAGDTLRYAVRVEQGEADDVVDSPSPSIEVIEREQVDGFQVVDVNYSFAEGDAVDYGDTLLIDIEMSEDADVQSNGQILETSEGNSALSDGDQDLSAQGDSSIHLETTVGSSSLDLSLGDEVFYEVTVSNEAGTDSIVLNPSPSVVIAGNVLRIEELDVAFNQGDEVGTTEVAGAELLAERRTAGELYDLEVYEVVNGTRQSTALNNLSGLTTSSKEFINLPAASAATDGDDLAYDIVISGSYANNSSTDDARTASRFVISRSSLSGLGAHSTGFSFDSFERVEDGDLAFADWSIDLPSGETSYDYRIEVVKDGNVIGTATQATGEASTSLSVEFNVGDSGVNAGSSAELFDEDQFNYRLVVESGGETLEVDGPTLVYQAPESVEPVFRFDEVSFNFEAGDEVEPNERLFAFFQLDRPDSTANGFRYEVREYVDGTLGNVVADTLSEEDQNFITDGDRRRTQVGFQVTDSLTSENVVKYELVVWQTDGTGNDLQSISEESGILNVTERVPSTAVALCDLAPTERLREDGDEIFNAQINQNKADITGFELILDKDGSSVMSFGTQEHEADEVQEVFEQSDVEEPEDFEQDLIDGKTYEVSLQEGDSNYLLDLFGNEPEGVREVYAKSRFPEVWKELIEEELTEKGIDLEANFKPAGLDYEDKGYSGAETPAIVSQDLQPNQPGTDRQKLFTIETISDGNAANREIKVSIRNVRYPSEVSGSNYGRFDVIVREFDDSDQNPEVVESFTGVDLNPESQNYIAKVIGNKEMVFREDGKLIERGGESGVYENRSDYIRVRVNSELVKANEGGRDGLAQLVPWGFAPYSIPNDLDGEFPHGMKFRQVRSVDDAEYDIVPSQDLDPVLSGVEEPFDNQIHFGVDFEFQGNESFLQAISNVPGDAEDNQDFGFVLSDAYVRNPDGPGVRRVEYGDGSDENFPVGARKFTVGFQGGFDGKDPAKPEAIEDEITAENSQGFDLSGPNAPGTEAYEKAIGILGNDDYFDINILVTPGVVNSLHGSVVQAGINMVEERADAFYVFDAAGVDASIDDAIASVQSVDSSYAATYYPWIRIRDQQRNKQVRVPPSVLIPRVYAFNDQTAAEWFAPAGFERGGIPEAIAAVVRLRREDRDRLYESNVNPIAQFPDQGVSVWGQKTLQSQSSALDRVNVRRLLIRVKKFIASTSRFLVFEQNIPQTRNRFLNIVNPFLDEVKQQKGLFAFRVKMNADNNPPEVIDRNQLVGEIFLQPTRTAEFIQLTFNVLPTGAEFEDL